MQQLKEMWDDEIQYVGHLKRNKKKMFLWHAGKVLWLTGATAAKKREALHWKQAHGRSESDQGN